jgi:predicted metal-dependent phosphoesterase TrpH
MGVDDLIDAAKALRLDGICLTEHDYFWSPEEVRELSQKHNFLVLSGCEINTDDGHVVVFGLHRYTFGLHKTAFLRHLVDLQEGVIIAAHPYRRRFLEEPARKPEARSAMLEQAAADRFFQFCDAIEGINGRGDPLENQFSSDLGSRLGLRMTGGSDAHRIAQLGTAATQFQTTIRDLADLVRELRAGRFQAVDLRNVKGIPNSSSPHGEKGSGR